MQTLHRPDTWGSTVSGKLDFWAGLCHSWPRPQNTHLKSSYAENDNEKLKTCMFTAVKLESRKLITLLKGTMEISS